MPVISYDTHNPWLVAWRENRQTPAARCFLTAGRRPHDAALSATASTPDTDTAGPTPDTDAAGPTPDTDTAGHTPDTDTAGHTPDTDAAGLTPDTDAAGHTPDTDTAGPTPDTDTVIAQTVVIAANQQPAAGGDGVIHENTSPQEARRLSQRV